MYSSYINKDQENMDSSIKRILVMGATGAGKSLAGNFILDGRNSGRYKSSAASVGGVTKEVRIQEAHALGNS